MSKRCFIHGCGKPKWKIIRFKGQLQPVCQPHHQSVSQDIVRRGAKND